MGGRKPFPTAVVQELSAHAMQTVCKDSQLAAAGIEPWARTWPDSCHEAPGDDRLPDDRIQHVPMRSWQLLQRASSCRRHMPVSVVSGVHRTSCAGRSPPPWRRCARLRLAGPSAPWLAGVASASHRLVRASAGAGRCSSRGLVAQRYVAGQGRQHRTALSARAWGFQPQASLCRRRRFAFPLK